MDINKFAYDVLNTTGVREVLRKSTPEIEKLESLDGLRELRLTSLTTEFPIRLSYEAIATADLYPHVRSRLIDAGMIKKHNVISANTCNEGQKDECESLHLAFHRAYVQAFLKVYNPNYRPG